MLVFKHLTHVDVKESQVVVSSGCASPRSSSWMIFLPTADDLFRAPSPLHPNAVQRVGECRCRSSSSLLTVDHRSDLPFETLGLVGCLLEMRAETIAWSS